MQQRVSKRDYQDAVFVREFLAGRKGAEEKLYRVYEKTIRGFLRTKCDDEALISEVTHEAIAATLLKIRRHGIEYGCFRRMIYTKANFLFLQKISRNAKKGVYRNQIALDEIYRDLEVQYCRYVPTPEEILIKKEDAEQIESAFNALPNPYRIPAVEFYLRFKSGNEIADELGLSLRLIHSRIEKARILLRQILTEDHRTCPVCKSKFVSISDSKYCSIGCSAQSQAKKVALLDEAGNVVKMYESATEAALESTVSRSMINIAIRRGIRAGGRYYKYI